MACGRSNPLIQKGSTATGRTERKKRGSCCFRRACGPGAVVLGLAEEPRSRFGGLWVAMTVSGARSCAGAHVNARGERDARGPEEHEAA